MNGNGCAPRATDSEFALWNMLSCAWSVAQKLWKQVADNKSPAMLTQDGQTNFTIDDASSCTMHAPGCGDALLQASLTYGIYMV